MSILEENDNKIDYYQLLELEITANESEIRKAYRKKALSCHPDKNPDNPEAVNLFHELSKALEILTDVTERAKYDKVLKVKKAAQIRYQQLDSRRQKLRMELERRERNFSSTGSTTTFTGQASGSKSGSVSVTELIENLRRESTKLLNSERELQSQQLQRNLQEKLKQRNTEAEALNKQQQQWRLKIKWQTTSSLSEGGGEEAKNGGYSRDILMNYLKKYGDILALVMSSKRGKAVIEYREREAAQMAVDYERGNIKNPLQISWINADEKKETKNRREETNKPQYDDNLENLVLKRLLQMNERKRLMEEMQREDEEEDRKKREGAEDMANCSKEKRRK